MKKIVGIFVLLVVVSCGKNTIEESDFSKEHIVPKYDTLAIDSFSTGATSVDVARKIRISSQNYQDSLRDIRVKLEAEKILKKEGEEKDKAAKMVEENKKKADAEKIKKEKTPASPEVSPTEKTGNL